MSARLEVLRAGPQVLVQDMGRPGHLAAGLSCGGAADRLALLEAAALLGLARPVAGLEMAGTGGRFRFAAPMRFALSGAPMAARLEGRALAWHASHHARAGEVLEIGGVRAGVYGYMVPAGGVRRAPGLARPLLGSVAAHLTVGIGRALVAGDVLELGADPAPGAPGLALAVADRFSGGRVRLMAGPQTALFDADTRARLAATRFVRAQAGNRQGIRLDHDGAPFAARARGLVSDLIVPGEVQMIGEGIAHVLLAECQTTAGYARIGSVLAADLGRVAQAPPGAVLRFEWVTAQAACAAWRSESERLRALARQVRPLLRDPRQMDDLLRYQLISGVVAGDEDDLAERT